MTVKRGCRGDLRKKQFFFRKFDFDFFRRSTSEHRLAIKAGGKPTVNEVFTLLTMTAQGQRSIMFCTLTRSQKPSHWLAQNPAQNRFVIPVNSSDSIERTNQTGSRAVGETDDQQDRLTAQVADVEALFERYGRRALAFLSSIGIRGADADDIHQQAWMKIVQSLRKKPFEGNFKAWLFQILRNTAIDAHRKKKPALLDSDAQNQLVVDSSTVDASLIESEYQSQIKDCLNQLADDARVLMKRKLAGDNYNAIAETLGLEVNRAHRIFFDAKASMTDCLKRKEDRQ